MQIGQVDLQNAHESCVTMCHVPFHVVYSHTSGYTRQKKCLLWQYLSPGCTQLKQCLRASPSNVEGFAERRQLGKQSKNGPSPSPTPPSNIYSYFLCCSAFGYCSKTPETVNFKTENGFQYLTALAASVGGQLAPQLLGLWGGRTSPRENTLERDAAVHTANRKRKREGRVGFNSPLSLREQLSIAL